jgi:hypothetical protein
MRRISRGELGSRRLVMLIFAGCPAFFARDLSGILLIHLEPSSDSLGDACLSPWALTQRDIVDWLP